MDKTRLAGCNATREARLLQRCCQSWLTVGEASEILRVDPRTIREMIRRSEIPGVRAGRIYRVALDALEELSRRKEDR